MKAVARLPAEPAGLRDYRAAHPEDVAAGGAEAKAVWDRFRGDQAGATYAAVRDALLTAQGALCAYCEQRLSHPDGVLVPLDQQVEHVVAKSGGPGRTLDGDNFVLCCGGGTYAHHPDIARRYAGGEHVSCGQRKDNAELGAGCDPRTWSPARMMVQVSLDGLLSPGPAACADAQVDPTVLSDTLGRVLNLNCERLRKARQDLADNLRTVLVPFLQALHAASPLDAAQKDAARELLVAGRLQPDDHGHLRAFWTTERHQLGPVAESWLAAHPHPTFGTAPGPAAGPSAAPSGRAEG